MHPHSRKSHICDSVLKNILSCYMQECMLVAINVNISFLLQINRKFPDIGEIFIQQNWLSPPPLDFGQATKPTLVGCSDETIVLLLVAASDWTNRTMFFIREMKSHGKHVILGAKTGTGILALELKEYICKFIISVRTKGYEPSSFQSLLVSFERHLKSKGCLWAISSVDFVI